MKNKMSIMSMIIFVAGILLAACSNGNSSNGNDTYHVGLLSGSGIFDTAFDGFKEEMATLCYVEGENITYEFQQANGSSEEMSRIAEEYVAADVDLIVTTTNGGALAAKEAVEGTGIPVIFTFVIGPDSTGVVDNLQSPGGNISGVRNPLDIFVGKRVELLLEMDETATKMWVPYDPAYPTVTAVLTQLREQADLLGVELIEDEVSSEEDVIALVESYRESGDIAFDSVIIFPDLTVQQPQAWASILAFANENNLPILANTPGQVQEGALFSFLTDNTQTGMQAARLANQIFQGTPVGELPVETAELFLTFNLPVAESLGMNVSDDVLGQATTIIRE